MLAQDSRPYAGDWPASGALRRPASLAEVRLSGFLGNRVEANRASLLAGLDSPIPRRFRALSRGEVPGPETERLASDSDVYKWIEGASYALAYRPDESLRTALDEMVSLVIGQQASDGYLNTQVPPYERLDRRVNHDLYQAGHLCEAAVAHWRATGETRLLDAACRLVDWVLERYREGHPYFAAVGENEHPEIEIGLFRLARAAGRPDYADLARAIMGMYRVTPRVADLRTGHGQRHAVRVGYLLEAAADLYLSTGDESLWQILSSVWDDLANTRLYVTGGLGRREVIPERPYDLPQTYEENPDRDIAETCASVAMMMFSWRMHSATREARFMDVIERILYNHYLGALSLDQMANFYYNPLRMVGDQSWRTDHWSPRGRRTRLPAIHSTACCLPNAWRFFAALPEYVCSWDDDGVWVNLYSSATVTHELANGTRVAFRMETLYPHGGRVEITAEGAAPTAWSLRLRIPDWCHAATVTDPEGRRSEHDGGASATLERTWQPGDRVVLDMPLPVRAVESAPEVAANAGQVAIARGPLVYCLEQADATVPIERLAVPCAPSELADRVEVLWERDLLGGVHSLWVDLAVRAAAAEAGTYREPSRSLPTVRTRLIPFYARANRDDDARWTVLLPLI